MSWSLGAKIMGSRAGSFAKQVGTETAITGGLSAAMYGAGSYMTQDPSNNLSDNIVHYGKWGTAGVVDAGVDIGLTVGASMAFGPMGGLAVGAGMMAGALMGVDPGTLVLNQFDEMDKLYDKMSNRDGRYKLSQNSAQLMQRQLMNLQGAGSNVAEMMHN